MQILFIFLLLLSSISFTQDYPLLVDEDFDNNEKSFFPFYNEANFKSFVTESIYRIEFIDDKKWKNFWSEVNLYTNDDYIIETKIKFIRNKNNFGFGLVFASKNYDNANYFLISGNGFYKIYNKKEGDAKDLTDWKESDIVKKNDYNILRIEKKANEFRYILNNKEIAKFNNIPMFGQQFGISVQNMINVDVDYIKVWGQQSEINLPVKTDEKVNKTFLSDKVNSNVTEKNPVISPDGTMLFYTRVQDENSKEITKDDAYFSELDENGEWTEAKNMMSPINNEGHNTVVSITADNNTLILMNTYKEDGSPKSGGLSISNKINDKWELPKDIIIEDHHNRAKHSEYMITADGQTLILTLERDDSYGLKDIYVSFKKDSTTFSKPMNLGDVVNSSGNEVGAFLAPDLRTLYFSSTGYHGFGSNDMYMSRRISDDWTQWTEPVNMGPEINSSAWDAYLTLDASGEYAYMVSSKAGKGLDILKFNLPESLRPEPVCIVKGRIYDSKTDKTLNGAVEIKDLKSNKTLATAKSDDITGKFKIILTRGKKYAFNASKEGYYPISQNIDLAEIKEFKEITVDLPLTLIEKDAVILLNNLFFDYDKSSLQEDSFSELGELIKFLNNNTNVKIEILGHTDDRGSAEYNKKLSDERAKEVMQYLISKGIAANRLSAKGLGEAKPVKPNNSDENRAMNRRVEFVIK